MVLADKGSCRASGVAATCGPGHWWVPPDPDLRAAAIAERMAIAGGIAERMAIAGGIADPAWMARILDITWTTLPAIATKRPIVQDFVARVAAARLWALGHAEEYARIWADLVKVTPEVATYAFNLERFRPVAVDDAVVAAQHVDRSFPLAPAVLADSAARAG